MKITKLQRNELDGLSKTLFGSSSQWQKLVDKGYDELVTEEVEETVPAEKEGEEPAKRMVKVPVLSPGGSKQYIRKYHTLESVVEFMKEQKIQWDAMMKARTELIAKIDKENAEKKAKEDAEALAKQVHSGVSGSAKL